ncbi:hypothetical protein SLS62_007703 [Diatrype stigma]|uniref:Uncharacterized protein n=1 Tax=Diatrype stigma TaxID=117547 RepID=A0AAN9UWB2_9PEZI
MTIQSREDTAATEGNGPSNTTLVIALSTVLSVVFIGAVVFTVYLCSRRCRPRFGGVSRRGVTPIGDDEIATWRLNRPEKDSDRYTTRSGHTPNASTSTRRAPSVIQYYNGGSRVSEEVTSPGAYSIKKSMSFDLPQMPESAVLAVAPNARSGLTDQALPGDEPFLPSPRRNPSRLQKYPPSSPRAVSNHYQYHHRSKGSRSSSIKSFSGTPQAGGNDSVRASADLALRGGGHAHILSSSSNLPRPSFGDNDTLTGLSPPPSRRTPVDEIGRALG